LAFSVSYDQRLCLSWLVAVELAVFILDWAIIGFKIHFSVNIAYACQSVVLLVFLIMKRSGFFTFRYNDVLSKSLLNFNDCMLAEKLVVVLMNLELSVNPRCFIQLPKGDIESVGEINARSICEVIFEYAFKCDIHTFGVPVAFGF